MIEDNPLAVLVCGGDSPEIAHAPVLLNRDRGPHGELLFHLSRANSVAPRLAAGCAVTAVINGPDGYVSAAWYEEPTVQVPTWNYIAIHLSGTVRAATSDELSDLLRKLAARYEPRDGGWHAAMLAPERRDAMLSAIQGFVLPVDRLEAKFKLSQNRSRADRERVRQNLIRRNERRDLDLVEWMSTLE